MPLGEIAGEQVAAALRLIASFFFEIVLEILVRGPGYLICRMFKKDVDPDGGWVVVVGLLFWAASILGCYSFFSHH